MCISEEWDIHRRRAPMFDKALPALSLLNNFPILTANPSLVNESNEPYIFLVVFHSYYPPSLDKEIF